MAPQPSKHGLCTRQQVFFLLLSTAALAAVAPTAYSSPSSTPDRCATDVSNNVEFLGSFHLQPSTAFFLGRVADSLFSPSVAVASTMLFCVFTVRRILQAKRNHGEPPAMSMAMLVVIYLLGCVVLHFILSHWVFLLVTFVYMFS